MAGGDKPFPLSEMMTQGFEQTRKAMESYLDFVQKNVKAVPWLDTISLSRRKSYPRQRLKVRRM